jgi:hypothetical protein
MSLYHALFGVNPFSRVLLQILGTTEDEIPRYRDCFLNEVGDEIIIHTRTGGENREYYDEPNDDNKDGPWNSSLRAILGFKYDADDDFDCTYADFHYAIPEAFKEQVALLKDLGAVSNPSERWQTLLENMRKGDTSNPETQRALAVGEKIMGQIKEALEKKPND